jgi:hypothetical protein
MPSDHIYAKCTVTILKEPTNPCELIVKVPGSVLDALRENPITKELSNLEPFAREVARDVLLGFGQGDLAPFSAACFLYPEDEVPPETRERPPWGTIGELTVWIIKWGPIKQQ